MVSKGQAPDKDEPPGTPPPLRRKLLWFRNERGGRRKALEEFDALPENARAALSVRIDRYLEGESRVGDVDNLGQDIYEIRCRHLNNQYRILFMNWGIYMVALTAFYKNQRKVPKSDLDRAVKRANRWREVFGNRPDG